MRGTYKYEKSGTIFETHIDTESAMAMICGMRTMTMVWQVLEHENTSNGLLFVARNCDNDFKVTVRI